MKKIRARVASVEKFDFPLSLQKYVKETTDIPDHLLSEFVEKVKLQFSNDLVGVDADISVESLFSQHTDFMEQIEYLADNMKIYHPSFGKLSTHLFVKRQRQNEAGSITDVLVKAACAFQQNYIDFVTQNKKILNEIIDADRDYLYHNLYSVKALIDTYGVKDADGNPIESIQQIYLRAAIGVALYREGEPDINDIKNWYDLFSTKRLAPPSPVMANAGIKIGQYATCYIQGYGTEAQIIQNFHQLRSGGHGVPLYGMSGLNPLAQEIKKNIRDISTRTFRPPVLAYYLSPEQANFEEFLSLRDPLKSEEETVRDSHIALWVSDKFMRAVENDEIWHQFSPEDSLALNKVTGLEYEELYEQFVSDGRSLKKLPARQIMQDVLNMQRRSGEPYLLFKDQINARSNERNMGPIQLSNLCAEIVQYTSEDTTAVCNVLTIGLPEFIKDKDGVKEFDWEALIDTARQAQCFADTLVEDQPNSGVASVKGHKSRALGIGAQGLHKAMQHLGISYDSSEAIAFNRKVYEHIYFGALKGSVEGAKRFGKYEYFDGSPFSEGKLQFDLAREQGLKVELSINDWDALKEDIQKYGTRNSQLTCQPPAVFWSRIFGNSKGQEARQSNMFVAKDFLGEYWEINHVLVNELMKRNLWDKEMIETLQRNSGSVQDIDRIPKDIKDIFKTVWEITPSTHIAMSASRSAFIDQSEAHNVFFSNPTSDSLLSYHLLAWKAGLKTGMYYLKQQPARSAVKITSINAADEFGDLDSDIKSFLQAMVRMFWTEDEIEYETLKENFSRLIPGEKNVIKKILSFFSIGDDIVQENIGDSFLKDVKETSPAVGLLYQAQDLQEDVHSKVYKNLLKTVCDVPLGFDEKDPESYGRYPEFQKYIDMYKSPDNPVHDKVAFAQRYMNMDTSSRQHRLLAFICVEGIMFSSSFAYLFHLKEKYGKKIGALGTSNDFIARDESLHTDVGINLLMRNKDGLSEQEAKKIIREATEIELRFVKYVLKEDSVSGMSEEAMTEYVKFVADSICKRLDIEPIYNVTNPLEFMVRQGAQNHADIMGIRDSQYQANNDSMAFPQTRDIFNAWRFTMNVLSQDGGLSIDIPSIKKKEEDGGAVLLSSDQVPGTDGISELAERTLSAGWQAIGRKEFMEKISKVVSMSASNDEGLSCIACAG